MINLLLFLAPFLAIVITEAYLRHIHYGFENSLFVEEPYLGKPYYFLNPLLKKKYQFINEYVDFYPIYPYRMKIIKEKDDFRIFCMGGSTTQGFPYFMKGSFPVLLEGMVNLARKKKNVEVVNLGVTAMNSHGVLDFMQMTPQYHPDLIVLYMGHNEFFGALGSASNLFFGHDRRIVRFFLRLQEFKVYLLARDIFVKLKSFFKKPKPLPGTIMQRIVRIKNIPINSALREQTFRNFEENLSDILSVACEYKIPVIIGTVVSNLSDFAPFDSARLENTAPYADKFARYRKEGRIALKEGKYEKAVELFEKAVGIFPDYAQSHYEQGRAYLKKGEVEKAFDAFKKAKDLDVIPFRAPSKINEIIRKACKNQGVLLVDLEKHMNRINDGVILGKPEMMEHLHPSFIGNYQIASYFADAILQKGFLKQELTVDWNDPAVVEAVKEHAGFTGLDIHAAYFRISNMIRNWPFTINNSSFEPPHLGVDYGELKLPEPANKIITLKDLEEMHIKIGHELYEKEDYLRAYRELNAASKMNEFIDDIFIHMTSALIALGKIPEAQEALNKAFDINPNKPSAYRLRAYFELEEGRNDQAIRDMQFFLRYFPDDIPFRYELGKILVREGRFKEALLHFQKVEELQEGYQDTADLIREIQDKTIKKETAVYFPGRD